MDKSQVRELNNALDPIRCTWEVLARFAVLAIGLAFATRGPLLLAPVAFVLIGVCQYHILVLSHEAQHILISRDRKRNDLIGAWCLAYPFGQLFFSERARHMAHHRLVGKPSDPDYPRYILEDKRPWWPMIHYFIRLATYGKVAEYLTSVLRRGDAAESAGDEAPERPKDTRSGRELIPMAFAQLGVLLAFSLWSSPFHYIFFWIMPLLVVTTTLSEFREFCEHVVSPGTPLTLKTFRIPRWQVHLLGPVGFEYHAEHHFHPAIPHYRLRDVAPLYRDGAGDGAVRTGIDSDQRWEVHHSYFDIIRILVRDGRREVGA
jgi:fatty acid desaturase